ncbi:MAG: hypothetical protein HGA96_09745 [Desulfobulbaceae bacterium]|nr:hypothetical protein [Desulfobulbaceae bacterium]
MPIKKLLILLFLLPILTACGKPVPVYKSAYIGEWQAPEMYLLITPEGRVVYKDYKAGETVTIKGPLRGFKGDDFTIGYGFSTTTFTVDTPPYLSEDATWRMVVGGVELVRTRKIWPSRKGGIMV